MGMKAIVCCADCANYSLKKHKCMIGCKDEGKATDHFYRDCILPDVPEINVGKWISVKDRLPVDGLFVLVCNDDGHMMIAKYESELVHWEYKYTNYDHDVWDDDEQGPVCWWMPLPEPPKEET